MAGPGRPPKNQQDKIIGPADAQQAEKEQGALIESVKVVGDLSLSDFQALAMESVHAPHPFEGYTYPMGKVKVAAKDHEGTVIGEQVVQAAYVVAYIHPVAQDPSGHKYIVTEDYKMDEVLKFGPFEGKTVEKVRSLDVEYFKNLIKTGKQRHAPLDTHHNRLIRDLDEESNFDIVFDRFAILKDGEMPNVAIVPSHNIRAQLVYQLNERTGKTEVNPNYALLDRKQRSRLLRTFQRSMFSQIQNIRLQQLVTEEAQIPEGSDLASELGEKD